MFVANCVQLTGENTSPSQWRYVDTGENPADHASRGLIASEILSTNWLSGPEFLWKERVPEGPTPSINILVGDPEVKTCKTFATKVSDHTDILNRLSRFSSWTTLVKVVARIKRLASRPKCLAKVVTVTECESAVEAVTKLVQQQAFSTEMKALEAGKNLPSLSSLRHLDPILKGCRLYVGRRLKHSSLSEEFKHPLILPKDSFITQLVIAHYHMQACHQG